MNNGKPLSNQDITRKLDAMHKVMVEICKELDLVKHATVMLIGSVIDLSNKTGAEKIELNNKVWRAALKAHKKSWKERAKRL